MTVKRYYTNAKDSEVFAHPDGPFVLWSDYERLEKVLQLVQDLDLISPLADHDKFAQAVAVAAQKARAALTEPKSDQWVQDGKVFEEDAERCSNMAHKRYHLFNCTECSALAPSLPDSQRGLE